ncbi:hypothetical protein BSKO_12876 [Bryopsis sp. KO-2023]|nr:hypothetical protein BSKO_12876 [Bryopsis sp. KO-2023]
MTFWCVEPHRTCGDFNRFHHRCKPFRAPNVLTSVTLSKMLRRTSIRCKHGAGAKRSGEVAGPPAGENGNDWTLGVLSAINDSTKYVVSAMVTVALLLRRDVQAAWWVDGSIASSIACKITKEFINETRPDGAKKSDPGMPSSHANSLGYLSMYVALDFLCLNQSNLGFVWAAVIVFGAVFLTWLRVLLGFHTTPQVLVGFLLGGCFAGFWWRVGQDLAVPFFATSPTAVVWLYSFTFIASVAFGFWSLARIVRENHQMKGKRVHAQETMQ